MNKQAKGISDRTSDIILVAICVIVLLIVAYPLYYVVIASFSNPYDVYAGKTFLLPSGFTLDGYKAVFADPKIMPGFFNSVKYTVIGTIFSVVMLYITAYPLAQKDLPGRKFLSLFFVFTMYFGGGMIPTYLIVKQTGLIGNMWSLFLPGGVAVGNMIIVRNFFENSIPKEMTEAAQIDGCGNLGFFFQIVIPLSKAVLAVIALWTAVGQWNSYFNALIYLRNPDLQPLQLVLRNILISNQTISSMSTGAAAVEAKQMADLIKYAIIVVSSAPIMCMYPFVQKHFNQGVMLGSLKG